MNEWIIRVMPLAQRTEHPLGQSDSVELGRFRIRILAPHERLGGAVARPRQCRHDVGAVRILGLDSVNPHGGAGGSFDSDQCAWLVRELDQARDRYVVLASHHGPRSLTSTAHPSGTAPRVAGREVTSMLLGWPQVIGWIAGTTHERAGLWHGEPEQGFWELPGAAHGSHAPLAGGLAVLAHAQHPHRIVQLRGALSGGAGPIWSVRDPLPATSSESNLGPCVR